MISLFNKHTHSISFDLGQRSIKSVSLAKVNGQITLKNAFTHDFCTTNQEYPNNCDVLNDLKMISNVKELKNSNICTNLGENQIQNFDLKLPLMPKNELDEVVKLEVEKNINYPIEKAVYDYQVLEQVDDLDSPMLKLKVYIIKKSKIDIILKLFRSAEMVPKIIDSDAEAITRALNFNGYIKNGELSVIIDLAETHTSITLTLGNRILTTVDVDTSVGLINHRLEKKYGLNYNQAEEVKLKINLNSDQALSEIESTAKSTYIEILSKVQEAVDYMQEFHFKKWPVTAIYFVGGGAFAPNLCEVFEEHYKIKSLLPNPFKNIELSDNIQDLDQKIIFDRSYSMAMAVGLALRGVA